MSVINFDDMWDFTYKQNLVLLAWKGVRKKEISLIQLFEIVFLSIFKKILYYFSNSKQKLESKLGISDKRYDF